MDLKTVLATCLAVIVAELGDKTQLAVFGATASTRKPWEVFLGAAVGLVLVTGVAVLFGQVVGHLVPEKWLRRIGAMVFLGIGVYLLCRPDG